MLFLYVKVYYYIHSQQKDGIFTRSPKGKTEIGDFQLLEMKISRQHQLFIIIQNL